MIPISTNAIAMRDLPYHLAGEVELAGNIGVVGAEDQLGEDGAEGGKGVVVWAAVVTAGHWRRLRA